MPATAQTTQSPQSRGWNDERREKHAAAIRRWKPWAKSTGPRSAAGKARTAQNAAKPWLKRGPDYQMKQALRDHSRYLTDLNRFITLQKSAQKNELLKKYLKNYRRALLLRGRKVSAQLRHALLYAKLCRNPANTPYIDSGNIR